MQLNMTTEYAFRALICLFRAEEGSVVRAEDISNEMNIPINYLQRVIGILKKEGHIETVRGQHGGYRLSVTAKNLTAGDVLYLYEPEKLHRCMDREDYTGPSASDSYPVNTLFEVLQEQMDRILRSTTVHELSKASDAGDVHQMLAVTGE